MGCSGVRAPWNTVRAEVYVAPLQLRRVGSEPYLAWKSLPLEETQTPPGHAFHWRRPPISGGHSFHWKKPPNGCGHALPLEETQTSDTVVRCEPNTPKVSPALGAVQGHLRRRSIPSVMASLPEQKGGQGSLTKDNIGYLGES